MPCHLLRAFACLALAAVAVLAHAEPDPAAPGATVPPLDYRSPLADYRGAEEQSVESWRDANDTVGRIGGWRTYAREAWEDAPAAPQDGQPHQHMH